MVNGQSIPELHYSFSELSPDNALVIDETGNGYDASLENGAVVRLLGDFKVLDLGDANGYLDLGSSTGDLMGGLQDFSIAMFLYLDASIDLNTAGNFVWSFGNSNNMASDQNGGMFFSANATRFAISLTHWTGEQIVNARDPFTKAQWRHVVYSQSGSTGSIYVDGNLVESGEITITPADLGPTLYNYLGRSLYSSDAYLQNAQMHDFRIYNTALSSADIATLSSGTVALNQAQTVQDLEIYADELVISDLDHVISDLDLPLQGDNGISISWTSSHPELISSNGVVERPAVGEPNAIVTLTAAFEKNGSIHTQTFEATVIASLDDATSVDKDANNLEIAGSLNHRRSDLDLPATGGEGSLISWSSGNEAFLTSEGQLLQLSPNGSGQQLVVLTATITKGEATEVRTFDIFIAEDEGFDAYLFAYFTGNSGDQEAIRFSISDDAYNYQALNNNEPVLDSKDISSTGGVRDPHILRGADGRFYMVVTDMVSANGWNSNRAMVLLRSDDLINWSSSVVNIQERFTGHEDLLRVWAPQVIFDTNVGKYMVYWSMKHGNGPDIIYYAYANATFTDLETEPVQLFYHPTNSSCIDGDIIQKDGQFHLFFKTEGSGNGIKKAVSDQLTQGYVLHDQYLQQTTQAVEGSSVFRLINSDTYFLIYDMYTSGHYQFTESTDLVNFSIIDQSVTMDFQPRHGSVIPITTEEKERLLKQWSTISSIGPNPDQSDEDGDFVIYPNPASDVLTIRKGADSGSEVIATLYNSAGSVVMVTKMDNEQATFNVSQLASGFYLLVYTNHKGIVGRSKLVVQ